MDQIKIGRFISACRKDAGFTQAVLAEKLGISDRAVSKCASDIIGLNRAKSKERRSEIWQ